MKEKMKTMILKLRWLAIGKFVTCLKFQQLLAKKMKIQSPSIDQKSIVGEASGSKGNFIH